MKRFKKQYSKNKTNAMAVEIDKQLLKQQKTIINFRKGIFDKKNNTQNCYKLLRAN